MKKKVFVCSLVVVSLSIVVFGIALANAQIHRAQAERLHAVRAAQQARDSLHMARARESQLPPALRKLEEESRRLARAIKSTSKKDRRQLELLRANLQKTLDQAFQTRQQVNAQRARELQERIDEIKTSISLRNRNKRLIIENRISELLGEHGTLSWTGRSEEPISKQSSDSILITPDRRIDPQGKTETESRYWWDPTHRQPVRQQSTHQHNPYQGTDYTTDSIDSSKSIQRSESGVGYGGGSSPAAESSHTGHGDISQSTNGPLRAPKDASFDRARNIQKLKMLQQQIRALYRQMGIDEAPGGMERVEVVVEEGILGDSAMEAIEVEVESTDGQNDDPVTSESGEAESAGSASDGTQNAPNESNAEFEFDTGESTSSDSAVIEDVEEFGVEALSGTDGAGR